MVWQTPNDLTGEYTAIMLKHLPADDLEVQPEDGWLDKSALPSLPSGPQEQRSRSPGPWSVRRAAWSIACVQHVARDAVQPRTSSLSVHSGRSVP